MVKRQLLYLQVGCLYSQQDYLEKKITLKHIVVTVAPNGISESNTYMNLSPFASDLLITIVKTGSMPFEQYGTYYTSDGKEFFCTPFSMNMQYRDCLKEINESNPGVLPYYIRYDYNLLRLYDENLESEAYQQQLDRFRKHLEYYSRYQRYNDLRKLRQKDSENEFIYGSLSCDSDDIVSYLEGMSIEEILERRKKDDKRIQESLDELNVRKNSCRIFRLNAGVR